MVKILEKSGKFVSLEMWDPANCILLIHKNVHEFKNDNATGFWA